MSENPFQFERMTEYDDPHTGEGKRPMAGFYRVYYRDRGSYLGVAERLNDGERDKTWRVILPNPHYNPKQGPGCYGGVYIGRHVNPRVITRYGPSRKDVAELLAKHHATYPDHRLVEQRPKCEEGQRPRQRRRELVSA